MTAGHATPAELDLLARARDLAARGVGRVSPNPPVGALVVKDGVVVGQGWHAGPGRPHAEVEALREAGDAARGATIVCTLEPCSHHGRTPPCSDALIAAGVARAVVGAVDPLERDRRGGAEQLRAAGVAVALATGSDGRACRELLGPFLTWAVEGRPEVTLKLATSLDGRIATASGESRWITGPPARALVHRWRAELDAVAVGLGTALGDDPELTARDVGGPVRQPLRVVFDSGARLRLDSRLATSAREDPVLVIASAGAPRERLDALRDVGVEVFLGPADRAASVREGLAELARRSIQSVLVEGGAGFAGAILSAGCVDRVRWFLAPMIIGGAGAPGAVGDPGATVLADAPRIAGATVDRVGEDVLISGRLRPLPGE